MDAATLPDLDQLDSKALKSLILELHVLGRENYLFNGSDAGGERAAAIYSLISSAKLNGLNPETYLRSVLERSPIIPSTNGVKTAHSRRLRNIYNIL